MSALRWFKENIGEIPSVYFTHNPNILKFTTESL